MVEINLTWQAASVFSASLLLSAFFLGGMIQPLLKVGDCPLCLIYPQKHDMFFQNGATFVYHIVCFLHFGGMASGLAGLVLSLIGAAFNHPGDYLKVVFAIVLPIVWVLAWGVQLAVLATDPSFQWRAYDAEKDDGFGRKLVPSSIWLWWSIFGVFCAALIALVITSAYGILRGTYMHLDACG